MQCPTAVGTTESNSKSVEICRTPQGKNNFGSPYTMEDRSTGGLALPAVPPATVREPHTESHRTEVRWNCKPEISNAEQIGDLRCTRIFDSLDSGFLRVHAEEEVDRSSVRVWARQLRQNSSVRCPLGRGCKMERANTLSRVLIPAVVSPLSASSSP